jgi:hypothetical protein
MSHEEIQQIKSLILDLITRAPSGVVAGSTLGNAIQAKFPESGWKHEYGTLARFIRANCGDRLIVNGKRGADLLWSYQTAPSAGANDSRVGGIWKAFTRPDSGTVIIFDKSAKELRVIASSEGIPDDAVLIPGIAEPENRAIASRFLALIPEADRSLFAEALKRENFWPEWSKVTRYFDGGKHFKKWMEFRSANIHTLFSDRVKALGCDEATVASLNAVLKSSEDEKRYSKQGEAKTPVPPRRHTVEHGTEQNDLRQLASSAILSLSETELRNLWLPLGAVMDGIRRRQH